MHHEVVQDIRVVDSALHKCHFQRLRKWCSSAGIVLLDIEIKCVKCTARVVLQCLVRVPSPTTSTQWLLLSLRLVPESTGYLIHST